MHASGVRSLKFDIWCQSSVGEATGCRCLVQRTWHDSRLLHRLNSDPTVSLQWPCFASMHCLLVMPCFLHINLYILHDWGMCVWTTCPEWSDLMSNLLIATLMAESLHCHIPLKPKLRIVQKCVKSHCVPFCASVTFYAVVYEIK